MAKPPKPVKIIPEDWDKAQWLLDFRHLAKEYHCQSTDRFRPFLKIDGQEDIEKLDKKLDISLMREKDQLK